MIFVSYVFDLYQSGKIGWEEKRYQESLLFPDWSYHDDDISRIIRIQVSAVPVEPVISEARLDRGLYDEVQ